MESEASTGEAASARTATPARSASSTFPGVGPDSTPPPPPEALVGETVGAFVVERLLGEGSFGSVYAAQHARLGTRVAIKVARLGSRGVAHAAARLESEARTTVAIDSPHVVRTLDLGRLADGRPYAVMTFGEGRTLDALIAREAPLPVADALELVRQIACGIAAAHRAGVVHRDLKPSNVLVRKSAEGQRSVLVLDFGSAARSVSSLKTLPESGDAPEAFVGTPAYCAPEQLLGEGAASPMDVYALGAIAHELLTGRPLWAGTAEEVAKQKLFRAADRIGRADLPRAFDALIMSMLAGDPALRPSMVEVVGALEGGARAEPARHARAFRYGTIALVAGAIAVIVGAAVAVLTPAAPLALDQAPTIATSTAAATPSATIADLTPPTSVPPSSASSAPAPRLPPSAASAAKPTSPPQPPPTAAAKPIPVIAKPMSTPNRGTLVDPFSSR